MYIIKSNQDYIKYENEKISKVNKLEATKFDTLVGVKSVYDDLEKLDFKNLDIEELEENKINRLENQIETLQRQLKSEQERVIKETIKTHSEVLYKELQENPISEFTQRDIEMYFKAIVWDIKDILK